MTVTNIWYFGNGLYFFPTEYGNVVFQKELQEIYEVCKKRNLPLFVDGARLGYGLASSENDVTLEELAQLCDVLHWRDKSRCFVWRSRSITNRRAPKHFVTQIKQHGALLAKDGRLLGIQLIRFYERSVF